MTKKATVRDLYSKYETDPVKESKGVDVDFGVCVLTLARAGVSNEEYHNALTAAFAPYNQVMDLGEMPEAKARELTYRVYAEHVIKRWRFRDPETLLLVDGLGTDEDGKVMPATPDNIVALLQGNRHDFFLKIRDKAQSLETYLASGREAAAKN
jgi:hypothetical protein